MALDTATIHRDSLFPGEFKVPLADAFDPEEVSPDQVRQEAFSLRSIHRHHPQHAVIPLRVLLWQATATVRYLLRDQPARSYNEAAWRRWHRDLSDWRSARRYALNTYLMALRGVAAQQATREAMQRLALHAALREAA